MENGNIFYVNVDLTNPGPYPIPAYVVNQRDGSILERPNEWEMSIVRFSISSELIPLFFPTIPNPLFPLQTNMSVTLAYGGMFFQTFVQVTPDEIKNGVFDYCTYLNQINDALLTSFNNLKVVFPAAPGTAPPSFFLDDVNSLISMYVQDVYLNTNVNRILIGINQPLQTILDMPTDVRNTVPDPNGMDYQISVNVSANLLPASGARLGYPVALNGIAGNLLQVSQEFRSLDEWSMVKSVLFTSSLIPVNKELLPNNPNQSQNINVADSVLPIVTDFLIAKDQVEPTRHTYEYLPTAEYRMIGLKGVKPFSVIDITAQYQTFDGKIYPIYIAADDNMSLKIMFRRKIKL